MVRPLLLHDTSVLLNLLATDRLGEIVHAIGRQAAVCTEVREETLFLRDDSGSGRVVIDLAPIVHSGELIKTTLNGSEEEALYVAYATELDDGEAATAAIAEYRQLDVAFDDRKAIRIVTRRCANLRIWTTSSIIRAWSQSESSTQEEVATAIRRIRSRARFRPATDDPNLTWWMRLGAVDD